MVTGGLPVPAGDTGKAVRDVGDFDVERRGIEQIEADRCVVDVNGVGYLVNASTRTLAALPAAVVPRS